MDKRPYSFVDSTFAFFQAIGRRPGGALWILVWHLALYAALTALVLYLVAPFYGFLLTAAIEDRTPDEQELLRTMSGMFAGWGLASIGFILASLVMQGAWMRLLTRDEVAPVIPLRFGGDEVRLLGVNAIFIAFNILAWSAILLLFGVFNAAVVAGFSMGDSGVGEALLAGLLNVVLGLAVIVGAVILMIRFAAAPALSVRLQKFRLFESVAATRGVAGWMFVSYITLLALYFVGSTVVTTIQWVIVLLVAADMFPTLAALENTEDPALVLQILGDLLLRPTTLVALGLIILVQLVFQIVFEGGWHGVGAYVARREAGDFPGDEVETPAQSVGTVPDEG